MLTETGLIPRKAYKCTIQGWDGFATIWPGETRGKAIARAWYACRDSGYYVKWTRFRAVRAPEFDELAQMTEGAVPWCLGWADGAEAWGCLDDTGRHSLDVPIS